MNPYPTGDAYFIPNPNPYAIACRPFTARFLKGRKIGGLLAVRLKRLGSWRKES